ncbi:MAG: D-alanyl-D-alanine carboxypeptidase/D-alanyl-D-alanine-endopeptidase [Myxococcales bacterium]|nr:D-alanyl-D-alanine carboxypeptidase/D-alanyl-D-alanine-endopeptidase [Myxococcales bacterium]
MLPGISPTRILIALAACTTLARAEAPRDSGPTPAASDGGAAALNVPLATPAAPLPPALPPGPSGTPADRQRWLAARLDEIVGTPKLKAARIGVVVVEVDTGRVLYGRNDAALYNPASNVKLITTAAALALLGPEYRFKTVLYGDAQKGGEVEGNLYLKGYGDPSLVGEDLWKLASDLASAGVKKITGDLAIDDTFFDDVRVGPGFEQKSEDLPFRSPNGAVSLNYNALAVHVLPGDQDGAPARVTVEPASPYFAVQNESTTTADGRTRLVITAKEIEGKTQITVSGKIKLDAPPHVEHRRVAHPDLYAGYAFRELLLRRGIKFTGKVVSAAVPTRAKVLTSHYSQPLGVLVRDVNKRSNNFMAEQVLKTLGAETGGKPGTWQKGVDAVARFLEGLGVAQGQYKMTNGSGLYDSNRFSPAQFATLLRTAYRDFRFAADFVGSLALAGADGTIGHRMGGGQAERFVRAKTGTLAGVSCLSGYAGAPGKMPLAFSILMNDLGEASAEARRAQDQIAEALVIYLTAK